VHLWAVTSSAWIPAQVSRWDIHDEFILNPFFTEDLSGLLFLVALGHMVRFGPSLRRWLCLDAPLRVFLSSCWLLRLRGYPMFEE